MLVLRILFVVTPQGGVIGTAEGMKIRNLASFFQNLRNIDIHQVRVVISLLCHQCAIVMAAIIRVRELSLLHTRKKEGIFHSLNDAARASFLPSCKIFASWTLS